MKSKKAEITTQQIVLLIILIMSFAVILFFLFKLNLGKTTDKEICHNSVVMRGSSVIPADTVSLNCKRSYVCLTEDGSCEQMTKPDIKKVEEINDVYQVLADEMVDCWWMFGEGKINYIGKDMTERVYCSICTQLAFDDSLNKIEGIEDTISKDELYNYLSVQKISGGEETYAEYLFGTNGINQLKQIALGEGVKDATFGTIEIDKQYFVMMGIISEVGVWKWAFSGGGVGAVVGGITAVAVLSNPVAWVGGLIVLGGSVAGGVAGATVGPSAAELIEPEISSPIINGEGIDNDFMAPTIIEANSEKFEALNCKDIATLA